MGRPDGTTCAGCAPGLREGNWTVRQLWTLILIGFAVLAVGLFSACGDDDDDGGDGDGGSVAAVDLVPVGDVKLIQPRIIVSSPFYLQMFATGVTVRAGEEVEEGFGHHHVLIGSALPDPIAELAFNEQIIHYTDGETNVALNLPVGDHSLRLLFSYGDHTPYLPFITNLIQITVLEQRAVSITNIEDRATVSSPFTVQFGVTDLLTVEPAGEPRSEVGAGHHHLIIGGGMPGDLGEPLPDSDEIIHYSEGETEVTLDLAPGSYALRLLFADGEHVPFDPPITTVINIKVE